MLARLACRRSPLACASLARRTYATGIVIPGTPRTLKDVAKLDMLEQEDPARIGAIWEAFHKDQESVAGSTVGPEEATAIAERGSESPNFLFPLRRGGGHFMMFSQYAPAHQMFVLTFLEEYRKAPEMAQPWASVHLFDELLTSKGVGLMRAEVAPERLTRLEKPNRGSSATSLLWAPVITRRAQGIIGRRAVSRRV